MLTEKSSYEKLLLKFPGYETRSGFVKDIIKEKDLERWLLAVRGIMNVLDAKAAVYDSWEELNRVMFTEFHEMRQAKRELDELRKFFALRPALWREFKEGLKE